MNSIWRNAGKREAAEQVNGVEVTDTDDVAIWRLSKFPTLWRSERSGLMKPYCISVEPLESCLLSTVVSVVVETLKCKKCCWL